MEFKLSNLSRLENCLSDFGLSKESLEIQTIPGDLSPRKYFRIKDLGLKDPSIKYSVQGLKGLLNSESMMGMVFESIKPPEIETKIVKTSDHAFVETTEFFLKHQIPVPEIFYKNFEQGVIFLEDLGDTPLITLAKSQDKDLSIYYERAIDIIHALQAIPQDSFFIFSRGFDKLTYLREVTQFRDFILPSKLTKIEEDLVLSFFETIVSDLLSFKKVLVHRDFHSWNLMLDGRKQIRLIDYQDALLGTRSYDLVALLHERDIDLVLPQSMISKLENKFFEPYNDSYLREIEYPTAQLQRDLKVSGLFVKVKIQRGLDSYSEWVPGTLSRIKRTLEKLKEHKKIYKDFYSLLMDKNIFS